MYRRSVEHPELERWCLSPWRTARCTPLSRTSGSHLHSLVRRCRSWLRTALFGVTRFSLPRLPFCCFLTGHLIFYIGDILPIQYGKWNSGTLIKKHPENKSRNSTKWFIIVLPTLYLLLKYTYIFLPCLTLCLSVPVFRLQLRGQTSHLLF